ncbi:MAG: ABC transporter permease [Actinomycetes bacterium]
MSLTTESRGAPSTTVAESQRSSVDFSRDLEGLDALELAEHRSARGARRVWATLWPQLAAVGIALGVWQIVVWSGWKPPYVLPPPSAVAQQLWRSLTDGSLMGGLQTTMARAGVGFALAVIIGLSVGIPVSQVSPLRRAVGSLITGLQTMPSIAWFPLAILLFQISEGAILFVVVLGAAPAIANGVIAGADSIPKQIRQAGTVMGATGLRYYREVVVPGSVPGFVSGLKQGWAFAWRSLMAGELLVIVAGRTSVGVQLQVARDLSDPAALVATMVVILVVGIVVDTLVFGSIERAVRARWGLTPTTH